MFTAPRPYSSTVGPVIRSTTIRLADAGHPHQAAGRDVRPESANVSADVEERRTDGGEARPAAGVSSGPRIPSDRRLDDHGWARNCADLLHVLVFSRDGAPWCNGSTGVFGTSSGGSNPPGAISRESPIHGGSRLLFATSGTIARMPEALERVFDEMAKLTARRLRTGLSAHVRHAGAHLRSNLHPAIGNAERAPHPVGEVPSAYRGRQLREESPGSFALRSRRERFPHRRDRDVTPTRKSTTGSLSPTRR